MQISYKIALSGSCQTCYSYIYIPLWFVCYGSRLTKHGPQLPVSAKRINIAALKVVKVLQKNMCPDEFQYPKSCRVYHTHKPIILFLGYFRNLLRLDPDVSRAHRLNISLLSCICEAMNIRTGQVIRVANHMESCKLYISNDLIE